MSINVDNDILVLVILTTRIKEVDILWVFQNWFLAININRRFIRKVKIRETSIITFIIIFDVILLKTLKLCCKVDECLNDSCRDRCCNDCLNDRIKLILILIKHNKIDKMYVNDFFDWDITNIDKIKVKCKIDRRVWRDNKWIIRCYRWEWKFKIVNFWHAISSKSFWRESIRRYWWDW